MNLFQDLDQWADTQYDGYVLRQWLINHMDYAMYIAAAYLALVFGSGPFFLRVLYNNDKTRTKQKPLWLRAVWAMWNLALAVFSYYGSSRLVPTVVGNCRRDGLQYTLCHLDENEFYRGRVGFSVGLYVLSKGPEYVDTLLMLMSGKEKVPFIQWFHHVTTFLFCWHAYSVGSSALNFAASLNYSVHVVMYLYFALSEAGLKSLVRPFAMCITTVQMIQFIVGTLLVLKLAYHKVMEGDAGCPGTPWDALRIQIFIVCANLVLFSQFFYNSYITKGNKTAGGDKRSKGQKKA